MRGEQCCALRKEKVLDSVKSSREVVKQENVKVDVLADEEFL